MNDTGLAAETRRLLDAATPGVPERCIDTLGSRPSWMGVDQYDPCRCKLPNGHDGDHLCSHDAAEPNNHPGVKRTVDNRDADAALIAAAPRLLANWLAREDRPTREAEWVRAVQYGAKVVKQRDAAIAERDRLADENRALREQLDAAQLRSIEASNPGIDMEEVRRMRLAYPDHERHETVSRAKYGASLASDIAADGGAAVAEGAEDRGQTDG